MATFGPASQIGDGNLAIQMPSAGAAVGSVLVLASGSGDNWQAALLPIATILGYTPASVDDLNSNVNGILDTIASLSDDVDAKQARLVSGNNIKTIGGQSLLGSGDITVGVDLSNYAQLSAAQTFASLQTFSVGIAVPSRTVAAGGALVISNPVQGMFSEPVWYIGRQGFETGGLAFRSNGAPQFSGGFVAGTLGDLAIGYSRGIGYGLTEQSFWLGDPGVEPSQSIYNFDGKTRSNVNTIWKTATATVQNQPTLIQRIDWADNVNATRRARSVWSVFDAGGEREGIRVESNGSAARLGVCGAVDTNYAATINGATKVTGNLRVGGVLNSFGSSDNMGSVVEIYGLAGVITPLRIMTDGVNRLTVTDTGAVIYSGPSFTVNAPLRIGVYTVATLPSAAANASAVLSVTDSSVTTHRATVAGGGSNRVIVFSNGSNWLVVA